MQRKRTSRALAAMLGALLLFTSGCQGDAPQGSGPSASASPTKNVFSGQSLPPKVDRLNGTPYYNLSEELATKAKLDGAPFILIAPQDPSHALLVVETGSTAAELSGRVSENADFSGVTEALDAPEMAGLVKDKLGLELKTDDSGKVVALRVAKVGGAAPQPSPTGVTQ